MLSAAATVPLRFLYPPGSSSSSISSSASSPGPSLPATLLQNAPSARYFRHRRPCIICNSVGTRVAGLCQQLATRWRNVQLGITGWAYELQADPYQLCHACWQQGVDYHCHPAAHTLIRTLPPLAAPLVRPPAASMLDDADALCGAWYRRVRGQPWSWSPLLLHPADYEQAVYGASDEDVLIGFWNYTRNSGGVQALVGFFLPFLCRLLERVSVAASSP